MARLKTGLDYFSMDVDWDRKMKLFKAKYKLEGIGLITELYKTIYNEGYYYPWNEETILLFADENSIDEERLREMVGFALEKGIFEKDIYVKYGFLTSRGIQKRYFSSCWKRSQVVWIDELMLIKPKQPQFSETEILYQSIECITDIIPISDGIQSDVGNEKADVNKNSESYRNDIENEDSDVDKLQIEIESEIENEKEIESERETGAVGLENISLDSRSSPHRLICFEWFKNYNNQKCLQVSPDSEDFQLSARLLERIDYETARKAIRIYFDPKNKGEFPQWDKRKEEFRPSFKSFCKNIVEVLGQEKTEMPRDGPESEYITCPSCGSEVFRLGSYCRQCYLDIGDFDKREKIAEAKREYEAQYNYDSESGGGANGVGGTTRG